jgi:ClpP class serine protease
MSKAHKLLRLANDLIDNKPLLMEENSLLSVVNYLENRTESLTAFEASLLTDESERMSKVITDNLAIIPIEGSLTYSANFMSALCGMTSYQGLLSDVEEAISLGVKTIVFSVDSGGGSAYSMLSTAESIRDRLDKAGVKSIAFVDGMSASAAFGLSVIADEIIAHPDASVGSVGVVVRLTDASEKMKSDGVKPIFITSAASKVPLDADGRFKEDFISEIQENINELHTSFASHVAKYRNISLDVVNGTQAKVFSAKKALSVGFIDKVMNHDQFASYLETIEDQVIQARGNMNLNIFKKNTKASADVSQIMSEQQQEAALAANPEENVDMAEQALMQELQAKLDALQTQYDADVVEALAALDEKDAELNAALKELADMKQAQAEQLLADKKAKLTAVVGTEQADSLFAHLSTLEDSAFNAVVDSYKMANAKFDKSELASEIGVEADGSANTVEAESKLVQRLKARQQKQSK